MNRRLGSSFTRSRPLALSLILALLGCARFPGTSLFVQAQFTADDITQLRISGLRAETPLFGPEALPESPAAALSGNETLRVLLPDSAAGQTMTVRVEGLRDGVPVLRGEQVVQAVLGDELDVTVQLVSIGADPVGGCGGMSCASGCCQDESCHTPSLDHCGASGASCFACDSKLADGCAASGRCACGSGAACAPGLACLGGACRCDGGGAACGPGQRCDNGACVCDVLSCADGCCTARENGTCRAPQALACGIGGAACQTCDSAHADQCDDHGRCRCGTRAACTGDKICVSGKCVNDADDKMTTTSNPAPPSLSDFEARAG